MENGFRLTTTLPASPAEVYRAWLSSVGHTAMTGASASATDRESGAFSAWDGYIFGSNVELKPEWCIVQAWRTTQFAPTDPDSRLEINLHPAPGGCELVLIHTEIPAGQVSGYEGGWVTHYFEPMREYFTSSAKARPAARKPAGKKSAKKPRSARKAVKKTKKKVAKKKSAARSKPKPGKKKESRKSARRSRRR